MGKELAKVGFDYSRLDDDTAAKLQYLADAGRRIVRKTEIKFIREFGEILQQGHDLHAHHGNGKFAAWATAEFDVPRSTAYRYLNAYRRCLSHGGTNFDSLTPTALYLASAESTPEDILPRVKKLAAKQQTVTRADVQAIIDEEYPPEATDDDDKEIEEDDDTITVIPEGHVACPLCDGKGSVPERLSAAKKPKAGDFTFGACLSRGVVPEALVTSEFAEAWDRWANHRVEIKKTLTPTSVGQQMKRFAEWGIPRAIAAIDHTIEMGWQGIREPEAKNGQPRDTRKLSERLGL